MSIFDKLRNKQEKPPEAHQADRVSGIPFPAYRGKEPYMFISYAHVDSSLVYPMISEFFGAGYNIWYDEGIEPGIEWPEEVANALDRCSLFVVFITPTAVGSPNVRNEINFALSKRVPFIAIHIQETALSPGLQLQMGSKQAILKYNMDDDSFKRKYRYSFEAVLEPGTKRAAPPSQKPVFAQKPVQEATPNTASAPVARDNSAAPPTQASKYIAGDFEWVGSKLIKYHGDEKEITLPSRTTVLYSHAFKDNLAIETIVVPSGVSEIQFAAFVDCPNLSLVKIEGGYVKVGDGNIPVASGCGKLAFQCHRNSLTHKELQNAFSGPLVFFSGEDFEIQHDLLHKYHGDAKQVRLPDEVLIIGGFAFNGCKNLESVVMSDNCGAILDNAFISCSNLRNITLGKNFSSLAPKAFIGCPYVRFSYYKDRMPDKLDQLFPDRSIVSEIDEG
jgi:hypothetical protein